MDITGSSHAIALYSRVLVELMDTSGQAERVEFTLVPAEQADLKSGLLDENAPIARLLMGRHAGQTLPYRSGDLKEVCILAVHPGDASDISDAAAKRREAVQKAAAQSEITSQMIFATAHGSKWGNYDVDMDKLLDDTPDQ